MNNLNGKKRILVVEDDGASLLCLQMVLNDEGYLVDSASDVKSALELSSKNVPDLLLTDISLPDGDGSSLWQEILKSKKIPAIAISGYSPETIQEQSGLSFTNYLVKPVDFEQLCKVVAETLNTSL